MKYGMSDLVENEVRNVSDLVENEAWYVRFSRK